jgi:acyl-CoA dehydrogenase
MDFEPSPRSLEYQERLLDFMDKHVYPAGYVTGQTIVVDGGVTIT